MLVVEIKLDLGGILLKCSVRTSVQGPTKKLRGSDNFF